MTWAALIKAVFEVDPLKCPKPALSPVEVCGGTMRVVSLIKEDMVIERILRHCNLRHCNLWKDIPARGPPADKPLPEPEACTELGRSDASLDYGFFDRECA